MLDRNSLQRCVSGKDQVCIWVQREDRVKKTSGRASLWGQEETERRASRRAVGLAATEFEGMTGGENC